MTAAATLFRTLNAVLAPVAMSGVASPLPLGSGLVLLETTGRVSGAPRQVPLLAARIGSTVVVSTVRSDSQWLRNLEVQPAARVWLHGVPREVIATVTRGPLNVVELRPR